MNNIKWWFIKNYFKLIYFIDIKYKPFCVDYNFIITYKKSYNKLTAQQKKVIRRAHWNIEKNRWNKIKGE